MKWSEMTSTQRDALIAKKVMGYTPVMCDVEGRDEEHVTVYVTGDAYCRKCHGRGHLGYEDGHVNAFNHQIIPPLPYSTDMNAAWLIINYFIDQISPTIAWTEQSMLFVNYLDGEPEAWDRDARVTEMYFSLAQIGSFTPERIGLVALRAVGVEIESK
jgi:hypothetical protein